MGAGVSSGSGGPAADMYERLVKAVLGRDKDASARPGAQETAERLLRVLQAQAQNLKVRKVDVRRVTICAVQRVEGMLCTGAQGIVVLRALVMNCVRLKVVVFYM